MDVEHLRIPIGSGAMHIGRAARGRIGAPARVTSVAMLAAPESDDLAGADVRHVQRISAQVALTGSFLGARAAVELSASGRLALANVTCPVLGLSASADSPRPSLSWPALLPKAAVTAMRMEGGRLLPEDAPGPDRAAPLRLARPNARWPTNGMTLALIQRRL